MSSNDNKHPCDDLTPDDDCNRTCCPDYQPDSDWCKAFNKRTLEQLKEVTDVSIDGMWFNIEDAKNTIAQTEQYLTMIYELLLACQDQIVKASSATARTEGDFESASLKIKEYVKEIYLIVGGAQYNGRHLLQDTTTAKRGTNNAKFKAGETAYDNTFPQEDATVSSDLTANVAVDATTFVLQDSTGVAANQYVSWPNMGADEIVKVVSVDGNGTDITVDVGPAALISSGTAISFTTSTQVNENDITATVPNDLILNDVRINGDSDERSAIIFRLKGPRGFCRNVDSVFNDFTFDLPPVGVHSLGLTSFTSKGGQDYYKDGLKAWTDDDGIIGPDGADDDHVDETVSDFNCAIKTIGVELDKMRAYRYMCCLREKQVRIYKEGQRKCMEHKMKI